MAANRKKGGFLLIIFSLLLIVGLGAIFFLFRNQILAPKSEPQAQAQPLQQQEQMVTIVITTQAIPRGTTITEEVVTTIPYPAKDMVQSTFFSSTADVVGKQAKYDLEARLPLTSSLIIDGQAGSVAAFQIPKGMVAISIPISRLTSVSFAPQPGDHVNVMASLLLTDLDPSFQTRLPNFTGVVTKPGPGAEGQPSTLTAGITSGGPASTQGRVELDGTLNEAIYAVPSEETQRPRLVSQTVIQDAIVLHVGSFLEDEQKKAAADAQASGPAANPTPEPSRNANAQPTEAPKEPGDITIIVSQQDAVTLNYLLLVGSKLNLVLRSAGDTEKIKTEPVTLQFLLDQYNMPNPAKLPYGVEPRTDKLEYPDVVVPTPLPPQQ